MTLLVLGGTMESRRMTSRLLDADVRLIYSQAGRARTPNLDCEIVSGGFACRGGLSRFLEDRRITAVLDTTHPYAQLISTTAAQATRSCSVPCWRYERPAWEPTENDHWSSFSCWQALLSALKEKQSVFLTTGQLAPQVLAQLDIYRQAGQRQVLRTVMEPPAEQRENMIWIQDVGPFSLEQELELLVRYHVDALVSKNSGGSATAAKLLAARQLDIPVFLLQRPSLPPVDRTFDSETECLNFVLDWWPHPRFP